jgi:energy-coupling factor transport system permease protein
MIQIKYFPGNTFLHRLDPRTKFLLVILFIFAEVAFLDMRILVFPFFASIILYLSAKIPFKEVKSTWKFLILIIGFISSFNALFNFVPFLGSKIPNLHVVASFWVLKVTVEGAFFALASTMRLFSLVVVSMSVVMTTDPVLYAPALAKLGIPYKGAFVVDLSMRYLPAYVDELETTMNAQMARGFKIKVHGGLLARILNTVPLLVPVAVNAMLSIYDVADAMELRAFGSQKKRTLYRSVALKPADYITLISLAALLVLSIYLRTKFTTFWIPI